MPDRYDNIIKSPEDKREYRGIILANRMKVLLISDVSADNSAASLCVNVGYLSDPDDLPGLAHFCEHMLFMGTKKYPDENDYMKYVSEHGGSCNATTETHETKYMFEIAPDYLKGALDRFSQFFVAPLFTESATEREINSVDSEHIINVNEDLPRLEHLQAHLCNPKHPYHKFGTGNKKTLMEIPMAKNINVRNALIDFHKKWYSSNIMTLAIIGKEHLDELEDTARNLFEEVEDKNIIAPMWTEHPFGQKELGTCTKIMPIQDLRILNIRFPMPDVRSYYKSAPGQYIAHLIGHEGPGSIMSVLKKRGWSTYLSSELQQEFGFSFFNITLDFTEAAIDHVDDIVKLIFQYINMLKNHGPRKQLFEECRSIKDIEFRFKDKEEEYYYVYQLVSNMLLFPFEEVLCGPYLMSEYNPDIIQTILDYFTPANVRINKIAKIYEKDCTKTEPIYGIKYHQEKLSSETIVKISTINVNGNFALPKPNNFIPRNFDLQQLLSETDHPEVIEETIHSKVWFKQDKEFLMPKSLINLKLSTPLASTDPICYNLTVLFLNLFEDSLMEYTYDAHVAGLTWYLTHSIKTGITISLEGFNDKMNVLLEAILDGFKSFKADKKKFNIFLENYVRRLNNFRTMQPSDIAYYYTEVLLSEISWSYQELLNAAKYVNFEKLNSFIPTLFSKMHVEVLINGNFNKIQALQIYDLVKNKFELTKKQKLETRHLFHNREHKIECCRAYLYSTDTFHKSSCTTLLYQCGVQNIANNTLLDLLIQFFEEPFFDQLRTKEQLGYIVACTARRANGTQSLLLLVQSERCCQYLDSRIEQFIENMRYYLEIISTENFEKHKKALISKKLQKHKTLTDLGSFYWYEILSQRCQFDRNEVEAVYLKTITKIQLLRYFMENIHKCGLNRRKLAIYVNSTSDTKIDNSIIDCLQQKYVRIDDHIAFKNSSELYPLCKPYNTTTIRN